MVCMFISLGELDQGQLISSKAAIFILCHIYFMPHEVYATFWLVAS